MTQGRAPGRARHGPGRKIMAMTTLSSIRASLGLLSSGGATTPPYDPAGRR